MADQKITGIPEHLLASKNGNDKYYVVTASGASKFIRQSTLEAIFGLLNKHTILDDGGANEVSASEIREAIDNLHDQNTDLGTSSSDFTIGFGDSGDIYIFFGESGAAIRYNTQVSPNVLQFSHDGDTWQDIGSGGGSEIEDINGLQEALDDLTDALDDKVDETEWLGVSTGSTTTFDLENKVTPFCEYTATDAETEWEFINIKASRAILVTIQVKFDGTVTTHEITLPSGFYVEGETKTSFTLEGDSGTVKTVIVVKNNFSWEIFLPPSSEYESLDNKATDFSVINDTLYPSVEAVEERIDLKLTSIGPSLPTGGTTGQVLTKQSGTDGDADWETPTGGTTVAFANQTEVNAGTEAAKAIAPNTLAGWWTNIKTLAQTLAAQITFSVAPRFSSVTASKVLKVDSNKDITSGDVALTELADQAALTVVANATNSSGKPTAVTASTGERVFARNASNALAFVQVGTNYITDNAISHSKYQQLGANKFLGNSGGVTANVQEVSGVNFKDVIFGRTEVSTSTYTVLATDKTIAVKSVPCTITFGAATSYKNGQRFSIVDETGTAGANSITISVSGSDANNGATTINSNYGVARIYTDATSKFFNW